MEFETTCYQPKQLSQLPQSFNHSLVLKKGKGTNPHVPNRILCKALKALHLNRQNVLKRGRRGLLRFHSNSTAT